MFESPRQNYEHAGYGKLCHRHFCHDKEGDNHLKARVPPAPDAECRHRVIRNTRHLAESGPMTIWWAGCRRETRRESAAIALRPRVGGHYRHRCAPLRLYRFHSSEGEGLAPATKGTLPPCDYLAAHSALASARRARHRAFKHFAVLCD